MNELAQQIETARSVACLGIAGQVLSSTGMTIQAAGLPVPVGSLCEVVTGPGRGLLAEVIGFRQGATQLMPLESMEGVARGQRIRHVTSSQRVAVGPGLLGRVVDGMGRPHGEEEPILADTFYPLHRPAPDPYHRPRIDTPLSVGIRSINAMLTLGRGQRLGVFAAAGVGKSVLLGMMARSTAADVTVIALVGERGREVGDFLAKDLGPEGLKRSVVVVSTSDQSPPLRMRACFAATAIAEYFRDQGADVLLLMDSITRMAMAGRQIGLAAGEPPATKGYPPSVFASMPRLLERCGRTPSGSITGLYTVLVEGDDLNEPVADAARGILDGHIWLSRKLAARGHYPAVSILESISRVMTDVVDAEHAAAAQKVRKLLAIWSEIEDLVNIGAYAAGTNAEFDLAIRMRPAIEAFLQQAVDEELDFAASREALLKLSQLVDQTQTAILQKGAAGGREPPAKESVRRTGANRATPGRTGAPPPNRTPPTHGSRG